MRRSDDIGRNLDLTIILIYLGLVLGGWLMIYSANYDRETGESVRAGKQLIWILCSFFLVGLMFVMENKFFLKSAYVLFIIEMVLLVGVVLIGDETKGARSWFEVGGFKLQPSEFGKFICALAVAKFMSENNVRFQFTLKDVFIKIGRFFGVTSSRTKVKITRDAIFLLLIIATFPVLILLQPDLGSALVYGSFVLVLYLEGLPGFVPAGLILAAALFLLSLVFDTFYIYMGIGAIVILSIVFIRKKAENILGIVLIGLVYTGIIFSSQYALKNGIVKRYQLDRVLAILGEEQRLKEEINEKQEYFWNTKLSDERNREMRQEISELKTELRTLQRGSLYNLKQSKIAIGSGGLSGKGYMNGDITKGDFIPEQDTDFIFCTIGEEQGFLGVTVFMALFVAFLIRIVYLAERQKSRFARIYGYSVAAIFFFHFAINVSMAVGLFPVVGIPLPFFSYGGSSLWAFTILLFIFVKLDYNRNQILAR